MESPSTTPDADTDILFGNKDGWPCRIFTHQRLMDAKGYCTYVWPDEGHIVKGMWVFHEKDIEPLAIDMFSASAYRAVYNAIVDRGMTEKAEQMRKIAEQGRVHFCARVMPFVWKCI